MKLEYLCTSEADQDVPSGERTDSLPDVLDSDVVSGMRTAASADTIVPYLYSLDGSSHDGPATRTLCAASTWAYSDIKTFAAMMVARGLLGEFLAITVTNQPSLVDATAFLYLSRGISGGNGERLAILVFRGTGPTNLINWAADASTKMVPSGDGFLHGGFLRSGVVLLPMLKTLLIHCSKRGESLRNALVRVMEDSCLPRDLFPESIREAGQDFDLPAGPSSQSQDQDASKESSLALYIGGHSLGGAFAALAGSVIVRDFQLKDTLQKALRSVYTFGQPMFCDRAYAKMLDEKLGGRLFRHVYRNDIVPKLPSRIAGDFSHVGRQYVDVDGVWVHKLRPLRRAYTIGISNVVGILAWVKDQVPAVQWLRLPFSWGDHSPVNYMGVSEAGQPGFVILGSDLGGDIPGIPRRPKAG